jgi:ABC-2 type transport system permease protein
MRNLLAERPVGNDGWIAVAWCVGIAVVAYIFAIRAYNRKALAH